MKVLCEFPPRNSHSNDTGRFAGSENPQQPVRLLWAAYNCPYAKDPAGLSTTANSSIRLSIVLWATTETTWATSWFGLDAASSPWPLTLKAGHRFVPGLVQNNLGLLQPVWDMRRL